MKQGIQDDLKSVHYELYKYGCYFLDLLEWAARDSGKDFSVDDVLLFHSACKKAGYVGDECFINNAAKVYNLAAGIQKYKYVERRVRISRDTYIVCNKKPMYTHFTLCYNGEAWDSKYPDRQGAAAYKADSYRVLV